MNLLFITQLITSFVVGGCAIAMLSYFSERASPRISGIILAFPSTVVLSYFFLGWALSSDQVAAIAPTSLLSLGLGVFFPFIYGLLAVIISSCTDRKVMQIFLTLTLSSGVWFVFSLPMAIFKQTSLLLGLSGYIFLASSAQVLLLRKKYVKCAPLFYTPLQLIGRAFLVGLIIASVVLFGKLLNPFWGGILAVFPAAFASTLIVYHWYYEPRYLFSLVQKVALGSISTAMYIITCYFVFATAGYIYGTLIAFTVSCITAGLLSKIKIGSNEFYQET